MEASPQPTTTARPGGMQKTKRGFRPADLLLVPQSTQTPGDRAIVTAALHSSGRFGPQGPKRSLNKKALFLSLNKNASTSESHTPRTTAQTPASRALETSTAGTPVASLVSYIGVEGEEQDRTIGRLMMKQRLEDGKKDDIDEPFPYAHGPREIVPGVYLGSEANANDGKLLAEYGFTHILNVAKEVNSPWASGTAAGIVIEPKVVGLQVPKSVRSAVSTPNFQKMLSPGQGDGGENRDGVEPLKHKRSGSETPNFEQRLLPATSDRPEITYAWVRWSHNEEGLVEAGKLDSTSSFLDDALAKNGKVLVHCQCGVSRSATVVIGYCMREAAKATGPLPGGITQKLVGMQDAYSFVKSKSHWVGPNLSLVFQLGSYERVLRGLPLESDDDACSDLEDGLTNKDLSRLDTAPTVTTESESTSECLSASDSDPTGVEADELAVDVAAPPKTAFATSFNFNYPDRKSQRFHPLPAVRLEDSDPSERLNKLSM